MDKEDLKSSNVSKFTNELEPFGFKDIQATFDEEKDKSSILYRYYTAHFSQQVDLDKIMELCNKHSDIVETCYKNQEAKAFAKTNDQLISNSEWQYTQVKMFEAWDVITGNKSFKVGVIDMGIDKSHPDLTNNIVESNSTRRNHGTAVSCMIGCEGNNGKGISGAMQQVSIIGMDATQGEGIDMAKAANYISQASSKGIKILNMSFGGGRVFPPQEQAMQKASQAGVIMVISAGNAGNPQGTDNAPSYPANSQYTSIVSAATDKSGRRASFSQVYAAVGKRGLAMPGGNVLSAGMGGGGDYGLTSGTSFSSPYTAGLAALVWSANLTLSAADVVRILFTTADCPSGTCPNNQIGYGVANAFKAVSCAKNLADKKVASVEECKTNNPTPTPVPAPTPGDPSPTPNPTPPGTPTPNPPTTPGTPTPTPTPPATPSPAPQPTPNPTPNPPSNPGNPTPTPTPVPKSPPKTVGENDLWFF
jgi:thermitase